MARSINNSAIVQHDRDPARILERLGQTVSEGISTIAGLAEFV
jgi:hypothetical protein